MNQLAMVVAVTMAREVVNSFQNYRHLKSEIRESQGGAVP